MRILKAEEYHRMPWRNGGGETAQVATGPAGATLADFDWRVSMARIDGDGPFSIFPETDRSLAVLRGDGVRISIAGRAPIELTCDSESLAFSGDIATDSALLGGSITDLNVMTHRGRLKHSMRLLRIAGTVELALDAPLALLVCVQAAVHVSVNTQTARLSTLDTLLLEETPATVRIVADALALVWLIEIWPDQVLP